MPPQIRVSAVSYLNTCPLVWGFLYGPQAGTVDLRFELPAACADALHLGSAEIGLVPAIEVFRQDLRPIADLGICSDGPVRSIFLVHRKPLRGIRSLAMDSSSRTSVALTRILLAERFGVRPKEHAAAPDLTAMLDNADAALLIGDPALRLKLEDPSIGILDLGAEWKAMTGLPMVYAVWAGHPGRIFSGANSLFQGSYLFYGSYQWGRDKIDAIVAQEAPLRNVPEALALDYLTRHIQYELDTRAQSGMREFERLVRSHKLI